MDPQSLVSTETYQLLLKLGLLAARKLQLKKAQAILTPLADCRPESEVPWVYLSIAQTYDMRPFVAVKTLKNEALKRQPDSELAQVYLALALRCIGEREEAMRLLSRLVNSQEPSIASFAKQLSEMSFPLDNQK